LIQKANEKGKRKKENVLLILLPGFENRLGEIITGMLPAGSVTGAPKKQTVAIIKESEKYERGWYTVSSEYLTAKVLTARL